MGNLCETMFKPTSSSSIVKTPVKSSLNRNFSSSPHSTSDTKTLNMTMNTSGSSEEILENGDIQESININHMNKKPSICDFHIVRVLGKGAFGKVKFKFKKKNSKHIRFYL